MTKTMTLYGGELRNISIKKFLECYGRQECLWNTRISSYKDKGARHEAYEHIIKELNIKGITHNDIRAKIKGVRTTYKKELEASIFKKGKGLPHEPKLCWFKQADAFLRSVSTSRKPKYAIKSDEDIKPHTSTLSVKRSDNVSEDEMHQVQYEEDKLSSNNNLGYEDGQDEENYPYDDYVEDSQMILKDESHTHIEKQNTSSNATSIQTFYRVEQPKDDDYQHFCNSVAAQLRSIPDAYSRSVAKFKIQQILFEAETGHYKKNACVTIPISN